MIKSGLVSITFRRLPADQIVYLARLNKIAAIGWGGDVHVPHGDIEKARQVGTLTRDNGMLVAAYGSYYRVGQSEAEGLAFESVLQTAVALEAPIIRVWAGSKGSQAADPGYWAKVVADSLRIAGMAGDAGLTICYEFHSGTLNDTGKSARRLLKLVQRDNVMTFWQPRVGADVETNLRDLELVLPFLRNVHVFHWWPDHEHRLGLRDGADVWAQYLQVIARDGRQHFALLEYVKDDLPANFIGDAETLKNLLVRTNGA